MLRLRRRREGLWIVRRWDLLGRFDVWRFERSHRREERRFHPLADDDPALDLALRRRFVDRWLPDSGFPEWRYDDALARVYCTVDRRRRVLRLTSTFTGSTRYHYDWHGDEAEALAFVDEAADMESGWVHDERRINGPTPWD